MLHSLEREIALVQRHEMILRLIMANEPVGILKLSELSGMPQHKVRYSLRILEQTNIIRPSPRGAISTGEAEKFLKEYPKRMKVLADRMLSGVRHT